MKENNKMAQKIHEMRCVSIPDGVTHETNPEIPAVIFADLRRDSFIVRDGVAYSRGSFMFGMNPATASEPK